MMVRLYAKKPLVDRRDRNGQPVSYSPGNGDQESLRLRRHSTKLFAGQFVFFIFMSILLQLGYLPSFGQHFAPRHQDESRVEVGCKPPLPNLFALQNLPFTVRDPPVARALTRLRAHLSSVFVNDENLDALSFGVITADGLVYEAFDGVLKANETDDANKGVLDKHSIFRIASGSKFFVMLELLKLREKGALNLDDPVTRFFPEFDYLKGGFAPTSSSAHAFKSLSKPPITIRQLATHMAGLTREYPRANMTFWPHSLLYAGPPGINGEPFPTLDAFLDGIKDYKLVAPQYSYPIYSNAGWGLLGQIAVRANEMLEATAANLEGGDAVPGSWTELVARDVFEPLGMNGSSFVVTEANRAHVVVARKNSSEVDMDFLDMMSASGGQHSSLSDYAAVLQSLIGPKPNHVDISKARPKSILPIHVIREWLHPLYRWQDGISEVGMVWEIDIIRARNGRPVRIHSKHGSLLATHSALSLASEHSYGIGAFTSGSSGVLSSLVREAFTILQPAVEQVLERRVKKLYAGSWIAAGSVDSARSEAGGDEAVISVKDGVLLLEKLRMGGTDVLALTQGLLDDDVVKARTTTWAWVWWNHTPTPSPIPLWSTGRLHEFRMIFNGIVDSKTDFSSCEVPWVTIDEGFSRGFGIDLIYFVERDDGEVEMHVPSAGVVLRRV